MSSFKIIKGSCVEQNVDAIVNTAKRNINANGKKGGKVEEVIITNYENEKEF